MGGDGIYKETGKHKKTKGWEKNQEGKIKMDLDEISIDFKITKWKQK